MKKLFDIGSVTVNYLEPKERPKFTGYKIMHPWSLNITDNSQHNAVYTIPDNPNDIDPRFIDAIFTLKFDGSCGMIKWNDITNTWDAYCRHDIKRNKNGDFDLKNKKDTWIECCEKPTDDRATHWPFFKPIATDGDRWFKRAAECALKSLENVSPDDIGSTMFTVEWMGEKINCKKCDSIYNSSLGSPHHAAVPHSSISFTLPDNYKSFNGLKKVFNLIPIIEGLVIYCKDGTVLKVRRDSYGLSWPDMFFTNDKFNDDNPVNKLLLAYDFDCKSLPDYVALSGIKNIQYDSLHNSK